MIEINLVKSWFRPGLRVLEIGGGSGFQAKILDSWGCDVASIDLPEIAAIAKEYPVQPYDGEKIPFPDRTFDVVFSSNVLEHVPHLSALLQEILRVIKTDGTAIHILPSSTWRFWTSLTHYVHLIRRISGRLSRKDDGHRDNGPGSAAVKREWGPLLKRMCLDGPHGAYPTAFHELYTFSRARWRRVFRKAGFELGECFSNELFYTGYAVAPWLSMTRRRQLSRALGPATWIYSMKRMGSS